MKINGKHVLAEEKLTDTPSRLFRHIWRAIKGNPAMWLTYINDWARNRHPDGSDTIGNIKTARSTTIGNITKELWFSPSLTFNKLYTALLILKFKKVKVTITLTNDNDEDIVVYEETHLTKVKAETKKE